jgi:hypothetical protein
MLIVDRDNFIMERYNDVDSAGKGIPQESVAAMLMEGRATCFRGDSGVEEFFGHWKRV